MCKRDRYPRCGMADSTTRRIPEATVARLPVYLRILVDFAQSRLPTISSDQLAELAGVNAAKVRKDLSYLGSYGTRGVGYDVEFLRYQMSRELGLTRSWPVVIVGAGNLGQALGNYRGFDERGFPIVGLFDSHPNKIGRPYGGNLIRGIDELPAVLQGLEHPIGVIATPAGAAQEVADRLVAAGCESILNFAPAVISVPEHVSLRKVDLALELQILSFYQQRRGEHGLTDPAVAQATQV